MALSSRYYKYVGKSTKLFIGAFGDLGKPIPFVVAYSSLLKMDAFGILFAFGIGVATYQMLKHGWMRL